MVDILPHTDIYTKEQVNRELNQFIKRWKGSNFVRQGKLKLKDVLTFSQLSVATSGKKKESYTLYRGIRTTNTTRTTYQDNYPSSWSFNHSTARAFTFGKGVVMTVTVPSDMVLLDLVYLTDGSDYEKEVIVLPGQYNVSVEPILTTRSTNGKIKAKLKKVKPDLTKLLENGIDNDKLLLELVKFTMVELKDICRKRGISGYSNKKKAILVDYISSKLLEVC